jgi:hypothetical protein
VALLDTTLTRIIDGAACNENGIFSMKNVSPGSYTIQVSALGYEAFVSKVQLNANDLVMGAIGMAQKTWSCRMWKWLPNVLRQNRLPVTSPIL